jgi:ketosteroid isomerase-like protein
MSRENVELARQAYDALNRRDLGAFLAPMDADVEALPRVVAIEGGYHGHDRIRRWWEHLVDFLPDLVIETVAVRDLGDLTLAAVRIRGHGAGSDTPLAEPLWTPAEWRDGKCVWWANHGIEAEALQAVGLRE